MVVVPPAHNKLYSIIQTPRIFAYQFSTEIDAKHANLLANCITAFADPLLALYLNPKLEEILFHIGLPPPTRRSAKNPYILYETQPTYAGEQIIV